MKIACFIDLDDTLFNSNRKIDVANLDSMLVAAVDREGKPLSYMNISQYRFYDFLSKNTHLIPTTGRNKNAFKRVSLEFNSWAICSFGGLIINPQGDTDKYWFSFIENKLIDYKQEMSHLMEYFKQKISMIGDMRISIVSDEGLELYLSIKHNNYQDSGKKDLDCIFNAFNNELVGFHGGWKIHYNDNNIAIMPDFLCKSMAVKWLKENHLGEEDCFLGVGDSFTDIPFMNECDFMISPSRNSQITSFLVDKLAHKSSS